MSDYQDELKAYGLLKVRANGGHKVHLVKQGSPAQQAPDDEQALCGLLPTRGPVIWWRLYESKVTCAKCKAKYEEIRNE